ncbi:CUB and sushi domain-containing protein 3-like [Lineus longissimus]|uniref:CUB and sushi domain-containing protein 3-like n=1 Tax=Lineus longissimus TaxID=88925 RepID=UPI002B4CE842
MACIVSLLILLFLSVGYGAAAGCPQSGLPTDMIILNAQPVYDFNFVAQMTCPHGMKMISGSTAPQEWKCNTAGRWNMIGPMDFCTVIGRCDYHLTLPSGDIKSPGFPVGMRGPLHCRWDIEVKHGQRIHLEVKEREYSCAIKASLAIDLEPWMRPDTPIELCHSGTLKPLAKSVYESHSSTALVTARKPYDRASQKGFWITYLAVGCPEADLPSGMIVDNAVDVYDHGYLARLVCKEGQELPSRSNSLEYRCNEDNTWKVVGSKEKCMPKRCIYDLTGPSGEIKSPGYPTPLTDSIDGCTWLVMVEPGQRIHLVVKERDLRCNVANFTLDLYDGKPMNLCHKWMNKPLNPNEFNSVANKASVYCKKHSSDPMKGFYITYKAVGCEKLDLPPGIFENEATVYDPGYVVRLKCPAGMEPQYGSNDPFEWKCGDDNRWTRVGTHELCIKPVIVHQFLTARFAEIRSPGYPNPLTLREDHTWTIKVEPGQKIRFEIKEREYRCNNSTLMLDMFHFGRIPLCVPWDQPTESLMKTEYDSQTNGAEIFARSYPWDPLKKFIIAYKAVGCPTSGLPSDTMITPKGLESRDTDYIVHVVCKEGFRLASGSHAPLEYKCNADNTWTRMGGNDTCISIVNCTTPSNKILHGFLTGTSGFNASYRCTYGFYFDVARTKNEMNITCGTDGVWNKKELSCQYNATCRSLPDDHIENGIRIKYTGNSLEDTAVYQCRYGFFLDAGLTVNSTQLECEPDGTWTEGVPACDYAVSCPQLSHQAKNAFIFDQTGHNPRDNATYRCIDGFFGDESRTITELSVMCQIDGTWNGSLPECNYAAICPDLQDPVNFPFWHFVNRSRYDGHSLGDRATYNCLHGFEMYFVDGTNASVVETECRSDGTWSREITMCNQDIPKCPIPKLSGLITNGFTKDLTGNSPGDTATYQCVPGFFFDEKRTQTEKVLTCTGASTWNAPTPSCIYAAICPELPAFLSAHRTRYDGRYLGNQTTFTCYDGFFMFFADGTNSSVVNIHCGADGKWSREISACSPVVPLCDVPRLSGTTFNGILYEGTGNHPGANMTFKCDHGFFYNEERTLTEKTLVCNGNGSWSSMIPSCKYPISCPELLAVKSANRTRYDGHSLGDRATYNCNNGTMMHFTDGIKKDVVEIECESDGKWSRDVADCRADVPECVILSHTTTNGFIVDLTGNHPGDTTTYRCNMGFFFDQERKQTEKTLTCKGDESWDGPMPSCAYPIECNDLTNVQWLNRTRYEGHSLGDKATFSCPKGQAMFFVDGTNSSVVDIECNADGKWSRELSICRVDAPKCPILSHSIEQGFIYDVTGNKPKDITTYRCNMGFFFDGLRTQTEYTLTCRGDGSWDGIERPTCRYPILCPDLQNVHMAQSTRYDGHSLGDQAIFTCHNGFFMHFEDGTMVSKIQIECEADGKWSKEITFCTSNIPVCPTHARDVTHGLLVNVTGNHPGDNNTYQCNNGYFLDEARTQIEKTLTCKGDGSWNANRPSCEYPALCPNIDNIPNAIKVRSDGNTYGDEAEFHCKAGFIFSTGKKDNFVILECEANGRWSRNISECITEEEWERIESAKLGANRSSGLDRGSTAGVVVGVLLIALIALAVVAGVIYYKRVRVPENKPTRFENPAEEMTSTTDSNVGLSVQNKSAAYKADSNF